MTKKKRENVEGEGRENTEGEGVAAGMCGREEM